MDKLQQQKVFKFLLWLSLISSSLRYVNSKVAGFGTKCETNSPTIQQTQVGYGNPPKYTVKVQNSCMMCPMINIHLKCGRFPQALVNPKLLKVLAFDDCVINGGLPLAPSQTFSFNYTHQKFILRPASWFFQCE